MATASNNAGQTYETVYFGTSGVQSREWLAKAIQFEMAKAVRAFSLEGLENLIERRRREDL